MTAFGYSAGTRSRGRAAAGAAYGDRSGPYAGRRVTSPEELAATGHGNLPAWAGDDPAVFWAAADEHERANGVASNTRILTLPRGLDDTQQAHAADRIAAHLCGDRHAFQWAIHHTAAADGGEQPHIHMNWSPREIDGIERDERMYFRRYNSAHPEKGGARKSITNDTSKADRAAAMYAERVAWADICNDALQNAGVVDRVDARSNAARGMLRPPERKLSRAEARDPVALANLHAARAAWSTTERAEASACAHERRASAAEPRPATPDLAAPAARTTRASAVQRAQARVATAAAADRMASAGAPRPTLPDDLTADAQRVRGAAAWSARIQVRADQADAADAARAASRRVDAAATPRKTPPDQVAPVARQVRAAAVKAAQGRRKAQAAPGVPTEPAPPVAPVQERPKMTRVAGVGTSERAASFAAGLDALAASQRSFQPGPSPADAAPARQTRAAPAAAYKTAAPVPDRSTAPPPAARPPASAAPPPPARPPASTATPPARAATGPYTVDQATTLLRNSDVVRVSADGTLTIFRSSPAEFAGTSTSRGAEGGLFGLGALLTEAQIQPLRQRKTEQGWLLSEYAIADLARLLAAVTRRIADAWITRLRAATAQTADREARLKAAAARRRGPGIDD